MDNSKKSKSASKGALTTVVALQNELSVHQLNQETIADARAMRQLRAALDAFASQYAQDNDPDAKIELERPAVIALLNILYASLRDVLKRRANLPSVDEEAPKIFLDHPAVSLIRDFSDILTDLDNAKNHRVFETPNTSRGGSLFQSENRKREAVLEFIDVIKLSRKFKTRVSAERAFVEMTRKNRRHKNAYRVTELQNWRKNIHRRKPKS